MAPQRPISDTSQIELVEIERKTREETCKAETNQFQKANGAWKAPGGVWGIYLVHFRGLSVAAKYANCYKTLPCNFTSPTCLCYNTLPLSSLPAFPCPELISLPTSCTDQMRLGFSKSFCLHDTVQLMGQEHKVPGNGAGPARGFPKVQGERERAVAVLEKGSVLPGEVRRRKVRP